VFLHREVPGNRLLAALPRAELARLLEDAETVRLPLREPLTRRGAKLTHAYFPLTAFVSQVVRSERSPLEVGLVGHEGFIGVPFLHGVEVAAFDSVVQGEGDALSLPARPFARHLESLPALRRTLGGYGHAMMLQLAQTAVCNRFHVVEQRLARWLLMSADRARSRHFTITHAFLATILGVRRVGVTQAAGSLSERGLIDYQRGRITIRDRRGLQQASCCCYRVNLESYQAALGRNVR
jgi:CRP-like cAMP-binding protein